MTETPEFQEPEFDQPVRPTPGGEHDVEQEGQDGDESSEPES